MLNTLFELISKGDTLNITLLKKDNNEAIVSVRQIVIDSEKKDAISPIVLKGSIEEINSKFLTVLSTPLKVENNFYTNLKTIQNQQKERAKKNGKQSVAPPSLFDTSESEEEQEEE